MIYGIGWRMQWPVRVRRGPILGKSAGGAMSSGTAVPSPPTASNRAFHPDGEIAVRLLDDIGAEARTMVEERVAALWKWIGDVRFVPRFRTPLERELSG